MGSRKRNRSLDASTLYRKSNGRINREEHPQGDIKLGSTARYNMWMMTYQLTALSRR